MSVEVIAPLAAPAGLIVGVLAKGWFDRKVNRATAVQVEADAYRTHSESGKFDAEAAQVIAATTITLLAPLQAEVTELRKEVDSLKNDALSTQGENRRLKHYIKDLLRWITEHVPDGCPPPAPSDLTF